MVTYELEGKFFTVIDGDLYQLVPVAAVEESVQDEVAPRASKEKKIGAGTGRGIPHCKKCGKAGHRKDHCPRGGFVPKESKSAAGRGCKKCGKPGHNAATCDRRSGKSSAEDEENPSIRSIKRDIKNGVEKVDRNWEETKDEVQRMQAEGMNSLTIARDLGIPLKEVNKYWAKPEVLPAPDEDDVEDEEEKEEEGDEL